MKPSANASSTNPLLRPSDSYVALRAVFIDGLSQKDAALRFGYTYDAFRQLVHQFRLNLAADSPPPFSPPTAEDIPLEYPGSHPEYPRPPSKPMSAV